MQVLGRRSSCLERVLVLAGEAEGTLGLSQAHQGTAHGLSWHAWLLRNGLR